MHFYKERYHSDPEYRDAYLKMKKERYHTGYKVRMAARHRERWLNDPEYRNRMIERSKRNCILRGKKLKDELVKELGGVCVKCGFLDGRALCIHHPNGNSGEDLRSKGTLQRYQAYRKKKDELELLCMNCHTILHYGQNTREVGSND